MWPCPGSSTSWDHTFPSYPHSLEASVTQAVGSCWAVSLFSIHQATLAPDPDLECCVVLVSGSDLSHFWGPGSQPVTSEGPSLHCDHWSLHVAGP
jgi:hypothetical protein